MKRNLRSLTEILPCEGQLQLFFTKVEEKLGFLTDELFPTGSQPARIYGHKFSVNDSHPSFRPIVSSIHTYNYNLDKFLCRLSSPLPSMYSCEYSFTFVKEVQQASFSHTFMVSVNAL